MAVVPASMYGYEIWAMKGRDKKRI